MGARVICTPFRIASGGAILTRAFDVFKVLRRSAISRHGSWPVDAFCSWAARAFRFSARRPTRLPGQCSKSQRSVINGLDHTMLGISRPRPLIEEWLFRRTHIGTASRFLAAPAFLLPGRIGRGKNAHDRSGELHPIATIDELASLDLQPPGGVTAIVRDRDYLQWRYFSGERDKRVYRYSQSGEVDRLVVVNENSSRASLANSRAECAGCLAADDGRIGGRAFHAAIATIRRAVRCGLAAVAARGVGSGAARHWLCPS